MQKVAYLTATIATVDSENDTADFTGIGKCPAGVDIPIFYHCEPDSVLRDNGALEGAAGAFSGGDEVIVQCEVVSSTVYKPLRVMGFVDKAKVCTGKFRFKLTRGDGTLITEVSGLLSYINLYNSSNVSLSITVPEYDVSSEEWNFGLADSADADENGYWVDYSCEDGIATQYPYRYKDVDKDQDGDLIPAEAYEDIIPYWKYMPYSYSPEPTEKDDSICPPTSSFEMSGGGYPKVKTGFSRSRGIKSSVPFKTSYGVRHFYYASKHVRALRSSPYLCSDLDDPAKFTCYDIAGIASYTAISSGGALNFTYAQDRPVNHSVESSFEAGNVEGITKSINISITDMSSEARMCIVPGEPSEEYAAVYTGTYFDEDYMPFTLSFSYQ